MSTAKPAPVELFAIVGKDGFVNTAYPVRTKAERGTSAEFGTRVERYTHRTAEAASIPSDDVLEAIVGSVLASRSAGVVEPEDFIRGARAAARTAIELENVNGGRA